MSRLSRSFNAAPSRASRDLEKLQRDYDDLNTRYVALQTVAARQERELEEARKRIAALEGRAQEPEDI